MCIPRIRRRSRQATTWARVLPRSCADGWMVVDRRSSVPSSPCSLQDWRGYVRPTPIQFRASPRHVPTQTIPGVSMKHPPLPPSHPTPNPLSSPPPSSTRTFFLHHRLAHARTHAPQQNREIAEAHMAVSVADWAEGNPNSAKREAELALRALLEGKLGYVDKDEVLRREGRAPRGGGVGGEGAEGVPVPLSLCVAAAGMLLAACRGG